jgi:hypothetical protein
LPQRAYTHRDAAAQVTQIAVKNSVLFPRASDIFAPAAERLLRAVPVERQCARIGESKTALTKTAAAAVAALVHPWNHNVFNWDGSISGERFAACFEQLRG